MIRLIKHIVYSSLPLLMVHGCTLSDGVKRDLPDKFGSAWYQGEAEITSYDLHQLRYGQLHEGEAVLIFVTEDFSKRKQVKLDPSEQESSDQVKVLKLNYVKKFNTGIYPYSMMLSVFSPIYLHDGISSTLKVTMNSQEWCGNVFSQMNYDYGSDMYHLRKFSYFEQEGDRSVEIRRALLEDEVWNIIRLDPSALPVGNFKIIPGLFQQRLSHTDGMPIEGSGKITGPDSDRVMTYELVIGPEKRKLLISYRLDFPHEIDGWEMIFPNGQKTSAKIKKRIWTDYWTKNEVEDLAWRDSLQLSF